MRFFYQDEEEKVSTKCVRVSSTATTKDVLDILIEKFRPDLRMLSRPLYALYEVHSNEGKVVTFPVMWDNFLITNIASSFAVDDHCQLGTALTS